MPSILKSPLASSATPGDVKSLIDHKKAGRDALSSIRPNIVASGQQQTLSLYLDVPIIFYLCLQVLDPPDLTGRINPADHVSGDDNSARGV